MTGPQGRRPSLLAGFGRDRRGASALEFAIVATPFIFLLMGILQVGIYYMAQSALDAGVMRTADSLRSSFTKSTAPVLLTGSALKSAVATNAGGLIRNDASLSVEIRQLSDLDGSVVPITDGYADYATVTSPLVLRAKTTVMTFAPGFTSLAQAASSAIVRRQGR